MYQVQTPICTDIYLYIVVGKLYIPYTFFNNYNSISYTVIN